MKLLLLFSLVAITFAAREVSNLEAHTTSHLRAASIKLQALHNGAPTLSPPAHLQAVNATACLEAWVHLASLLNGSCGEVAVLYGPNVTDYNVSNIIYNQCEAKDSDGFTCQDKVNGAIVKFSDYCSGPGLLGIDVTARASLDLWLTMSKLPCIKDGMQYCYPIFNDNLHSFQTELDAGATVDSTLLNQVCIPCVTKVINQLAVWGIKEFVAASAQLKIVCTKRNGQYCFPTFVAATKVNGLDSQDDMNVVCDDCTRIIAFRLWLANTLLGHQGNATQKQELQSFLELQAFFCQKNNNNQYCLPLLQNYDSSNVGPACTGVLLGAQCAGSTCQTEIKNFKNAVGCCFGTWFSWMNFYYTYNQSGYNAEFHNIPPAAIKLLVEQTCGVEVPVSCATQKLLVAWTIRNILQDWYDAHQDWFEAQFRQIVGYVLAIDANLQVNVTSTYNAAAMTIDVTVNVAGFSNHDVSFYAQYLADPTQVHDDTSSVTVAIKDTDSANGASQVAALKDPITVNAQSILVCDNQGNNCSWAFLTTPSFSLLALLALLLAYFN